MCMCNNTHASLHTCAWLMVKAKAPPRWSAAGQPNDQWHQWVKQIMRIWRKLLNGWQRNIFLRASLEDMHVNINGIVCGISDMGHPDRTKSSKIGLQTIT